MRLLINEAVARAQSEGRPIEKRELARLLFPDVAPESRVVTMANICSGRTKRIAPEWVPIICAACGCSADYLFGLSNQ
jgi:hypothetical protein